MKYFFNFLFCFLFCENTNPDSMIADCREFDSSLNILFDDETIKFLLRAMRNLKFIFGDGAISLNRPLKNNFVPFAKYGNCT